MADITTLEGATTKELLDQAFDNANERLAEATASNNPAAAREFALVKTSIEDAKMRFTRGMAKLAGVFNEIDLETSRGQDRATANYRADHPEA